MDLSDFFRAHPKAALGLSGGADSAYLLHAARACGADIAPFFVQSAFQPRAALADAQRLCAHMGLSLRVLTLDVFALPALTENGAARCYLCKKAMFSAIAAAAQAEGYELLLDGSNASDAEADRPGLRALRELSVRSPLRECGLTKAEIRRRSRAAGLFTADKPANACLATRIASGEPITPAALAAAAQAEEALAALGFSDFRVRCRGGDARLQVTAAQLPLVLARRAEILQALRPLYGAVTLDLEVRT